VNEGFHREGVAVGDKLVKFVLVLAERQRRSAQEDGAVAEARRVVEMQGIVAPGIDGRVRRLPAKRSAGMRRVWRLLKEWLKTANAVLEMQGLTKQERWYAHQWCECWVGIQHQSRGAEDQRILCISRNGNVFRRQVQDAEEQHPTDAVAVEELAGSDAEESGAAVSEDGEDSEESAEPLALGWGASNIPVEMQDGVQCLKHSLNNILYAYGGGDSIASSAMFEEAARALNAKLRDVEHIPPEEFAGREGYAIEVAEEYLQVALPCCRLQHSVSPEVGDGESILGAVVHEAARGHFVCCRPRHSGEWEKVDSVGRQVETISRELALSMVPNSYFLYHQNHDCDHLLDEPVAADISGEPYAHGGEDGAATGSSGVLLFCRQCEIIKTIGNTGVCIVCICTCIYIYIYIYICI